MTIIESYLEKAWGASVEQPKIEDVQLAIRETCNMDDEHGAFWVAVFDHNDKEIVLEVYKDMTMTLVIDPDTSEEISKNAANWEEVLTYFSHLLDGNISIIEDWIKKKE